MYNRRVGARASVSAVDWLAHTALSSSAPRASEHSDDVPSSNWRSRGRAPYIRAERALRPRRRLDKCNSPASKQRLYICSAFLAFRQSQSIYLYLYTPQGSPRCCSIFFFPFPSLFIYTYICAVLVLFPSSASSRNTHKRAPFPNEI